MRITFYSALACAALMATELVCAVRPEMKENRLAQYQALDEAYLPDFASIVMEATQIDDASDSDLEDLVLAEINR